MKEKETIARKSAVRLALLGIVLILGIGVAVGFQYYRQNMSVYTDMAYSYVNLATNNISGSGLHDLIERGEEVREIKLQIAQAEDPEAAEKEMLDRLIVEDEDLFALLSLWEGVQFFIQTGGLTSSDIRYYYVVIPTEEDLIYLWDSDIDDGKITPPMEHDEYSPGEKENLMKAFRGEWDNTLAVYHEKSGEILGTAMMPIFEADGTIVAVACVDVSISGIRKTFFRMLLNVTFVISLILVVTGMVYFSFMKRQVISPIVKLNRATSELVSNLEHGNTSPFRVDVHTGDEIEVLARSFEEMDQKLLDYIQEIGTITAERERISTELSLATRIQADMLPGIFPPFPDRSEFDIYASMRPAKEVGGDFYDFFLIDPDRLGLVIADVSGKGIPAALFMMMSKIMIQNYTLSGLSPREVLAMVNDQICANNKEQMFVTVWLGVLDIRTGVLTAANAGHEYPAQKDPDGEFELIRDPHSFVVGGMENIRYKEYEMKLRRGSRLFLYTDGLAEASNLQEEFFGTERLVDALNEVKDCGPKQILDHMKERVNEFVGNVPQSDDLTMMCIVWNGPEDDSAAQASNQR